ncbi:hypothetical protein LOAG_07353 [Loa loa]|uniref:Uncharacterized protein n=1 Tax=Loa loa TaxID=7209 RepID=A0A1S0TVZ6_LOALO|nr:hypothetical protein LOAG_07353 [Loa loa]EFO21138.1 hypothetical protein LOAG_07353 [Loa loa]
MIACCVALGKLLTNALKLFYNNEKESCCNYQIMIKSTSDFSFANLQYIYPPEEVLNNVEGSVEYVYLKLSFNQFFICYDRTLLIYSSSLVSGFTYIYIDEIGISKLIE